MLCDLAKQSIKTREEETRAYKEKIQDQGKTKPGLGVYSSWGSRQRASLLVLASLG